MSAKTPTREQLVILYQCLIAVGQGAGGYRVSRKTCEAIETYCLRYLQDSRPGTGNGKSQGQERVERWGEADYGPQALERLRVIGQLAAHRACGQGYVVVGPGHFEKACEIVEDRNRTIAGLWKKTTEGLSPDEPAPEEHSTWCTEPPTDS